MPWVRLTVTPLWLVFSKVASRVALIRLATSVIVQSQSFSSKSVLPGARYKGFYRRRGLLESCPTEMDLGSSAPRLCGFSGSPSALMM